jgi:phospholipid N-methyltransferase
MLKSISSIWTKRSQQSIITGSDIVATQPEENASYSEHLVHAPGTVGYVDIYAQEYIYNNILSNIPKDDSIIDFGAGRGDLYGALLRHERNTDSYIGIEFSTVLSDVGKSKYPNIDILVEDWFKLSSSITRDWAVAISSFDVMYHANQATNPYEYLCDSIEQMLIHANKGVIITFLRYDIDASKQNILTYNCSIIHDRILMNKNFIIDATSIPDTIKLIVFKS